MANWETITWFPQTKLQRPKLPEYIVPRPRILDLLTEVVYASRLTLISAPAGYGKTTLITTWLQQKEAAWLSLSAEDDDPVVFFMILTAALRRLNPACGRTLQTTLDDLAVSNLNPHQIVGMLINDIVETMPDPFVVVLDDLHFITDPAIYTALDYLLEHLPPQMHLVVTTRTEPPLALARLRARGQLGELRLPDLRFTLEETEELLNDRLELNLNSAELSSLQTNTEGWAAGLHLLAASITAISDSDQRIRFIDNLAQTHRHVFDLLAEEVLNRQPPAIRTFLLETAILSELTPDLCTAVTGQADAPLLLEEVYRRNLFLIAVDNDQSIAAAYRYHALFSEFLHHQLVRQYPEKLPILHHRAAAAHPIPARAIHHYLTAGAWAAAAERIEQIAEQLFSQGLLETLANWILALPEDIRRGRPWLSYFLGVCAWGQSHYTEAGQWLQQARSDFEALGDERGQGETAVQLSILHQTAGNFDLAAQLIQQALTSPISIRSRVQLYLALAWLDLGRGALESAQDNLEAALSLAETNHDRGALQILAMQIRYVFQCLPRAANIFDRLRRLIASHNPTADSPWQAASDDLLCILHLFQGRLDEAIQAGERAHSISKRLGNLQWLMHSLSNLLPTLYAARADYTQANDLFREYAYVLDTHPGWRATMLYLRARTYWLQDRFTEARETYDQMQAAAQEHEWPSGHVLRTLMQGILYMSDGNDRSEERRGAHHRAHHNEEAERTLRQAVSLQQQVPVSTTISNARLWLAYFYQQRGQPKAALSELESLLIEHEQQGKTGLLLMEGQILIPLLQLAIDQNVKPKLAAGLLDVLAIEAKFQPLFVPETGETLTPREVEVLRLLASGASNRAIADQLIVTVPTVKTHVSRILGKLGVQSRTEAAARARDLNLI